jgi:hypothetical protein
VNQFFIKQLVLITLAYFMIAANERIALIIGADKGLISDRQLQFATTDAKKISSVFQELGDFQPSRCYLLSNPDVKQVEKTFDELKGRVKEIQESGKKVECFVYYSGHGSNDALHINGTILPHRELLSIVDSLHADLTVVIVDACYSGALVTDKGISITGPLSLKLTDTLSVQGTILLTSSSSDQTSHESVDIGGSIFTHHILSALRGAADYDRNGEISLSEAYSYARIHTTKATGFDPGVIQQPSYSWNVKGNREIYLSRLNRGTTMLYLEKGKPCPHFVIDEKTQSVIVQFTPDEEPVQLALSPGRYRVQRICNNEISYTEADCTWKKACTLSLASLKTVTPSILSRKGPLDRPTRCHSINAGVLLFNTYPTSGTFFAAPSVSYTVYTGFYQAGINCAYGKDRITGSTISVDRSVIHIAGSAGKSVYVSRFWTLLFGLETGVQLLQQQTIRKDELRLLSIGYTPVPVEKTTVPFLGGLATITPFIAGRIPLHCTIGVHDYIAKTSTGYAQFFRFNAGFTTGIIMSGHMGR